eukprot:4744681-Heterocapsa_arctica.AAC.1
MDKKLVTQKRSSASLQSKSDTVNVEKVMKEIKDVNEGTVPVYDMKERLGLAQDTEKQLTMVREFL